MKKINRDIGVFLTSFICTIVLLTGLIGIIIADKYSREILFGENTPFLEINSISDEYFVNICTLGFKLDINITEFVEFVNFD